MPRRYRVVTDDGASTREPTQAELGCIREYHGRYVTERQVEPMAAHEVPGVEQLVLFEVIHN